MNDRRGKDGTGGTSIPAPALKNAPRKQESSRANNESAIGAGLRSLYQEVVNEPLPDDMLALLEQLDAPEHGSH